MTDKMIKAPEIEYSVLRKLADDKRCNFKELCDAVREAVEAPLRLRDALREAAQPECCGNPTQCWEPCGELGKSAEHAAVAPDEELRRDAERMKFAAEAPNLHGQVYLSCRLRGASHQQALDLAHDAEKMYGPEQVSEADLHIILEEISDAIDAEKQENSND